MSQKYEPFDWYEAPQYYDAIFDVDTPQEAEFLDAMHALYGLTKGRKALEPACGSGRLVAAMAERGWRVTGFDLADGSLKFARERLKERGLKGKLVNAAMQSFDCGGGYDLAHCLVSTFKYLRTEDEARTHLELVAEALKSGGVYVLGLHLTNYNHQKQQRERWTAKRNGAEIVCNIQTQPPSARKRTEEVRSRIVVTKNGKTRRYETGWTFRTYNLAQLRSLLASVPAFEHVATYDFHHDPEHPTQLDGEMLDNVLILRKK